MDLSGYSGGQKAWPAAPMAKPERNPESLSNRLHQTLTTLFHCESTASVISEAISEAIEPVAKEVDRPYSSDVPSSVPSSLAHLTLELQNVAARLDTLLTVIASKL